ncbi:MAG: PilZ domain-containing protein [Polyangiales bacterium]
MTAMLWERRKFFRIPISGKALLQHGEHLDGLYRLHDLSIGGCMLTHGPAREPGDRVAVTLRFEGEPALERPAKVVRNESAPDGSHISLCFTDRDPLFEDKIQDLVMRSIEREQRHEVLIVHAHPERVTPLFDSMREVGQTTVLARTPREALEVLERGSERVRLAIVAPVVGTSNARDIVKLIMRRFPKVNCVLLSRGGAGRLVRAIRSAAPAERRGHLAPWSLTRLRKVISKHELIMVTQARA